MISKTTEFRGYIFDDHIARGHRELAIEDLAPPDAVSPNGASNTRRSGTFRVTIEFEPDVEVSP